MKLKTWRTEQNKTMRDCAAALGLSDARSYQRYETGEQWPNVKVVDAIIGMTAGAVTVEDLHLQRRAYVESRVASQEAAE